jgi:hypothetical protein
MISNAFASFAPFPTSVCRHLLARTASPSYAGTRLAGVTPYRYMTQRPRKSEGRSIKRELASLGVKVGIKSAMAVIGDVGLATRGLHGAAAARVPSSTPVVARKSVVYPASSMCLSRMPLHP